MTTDLHPEFSARLDSYAGPFAGWHLELDEQTHRPQVAVTIYPAVHDLHNRQTPKQTLAQVRKAFKNISGVEVDVPESIASMTFKGDLGAMFTTLAQLSSTYITGSLAARVLGNAHAFTLTETERDVLTRIVEENGQHPGSFTPQSLVPA